MNEELSSPQGFLVWNIHLVPNAVSLPKEYDLGAFLICGTVGTPTVDAFRGGTDGTGRPGVLMTATADACRVFSSARDGRMPQSTAFGAMRSCGGIRLDWHQQHADLDLSGKFSKIMEYNFDCSGWGVISICEAGDLCLKPLGCDSQFNIV